MLFTAVNCFSALQRYFEYLRAAPLPVICYAFAFIKITCVVFRDQSNSNHILNFEQLFKAVWRLLYLINHFKLLIARGNKSITATDKQ